MNKKLFILFSITFLLTTLGIAPMDEKKELAYIIGYLYENKRVTKETKIKLQDKEDLQEVVIDALNNDLDWKKNYTLKNIATLLEEKNPSSAENAIKKLITIIHFLNKEKKLLRFPGLGLSLSLPSSPSHTKQEKKEHFPLINKNQRGQNYIIFNHSPANHESESESGSENEIEIDEESYENNEE